MTFISEVYLSDLYSAPVMALRGKLWAACRHGNTDLLITCLQIAQSVKKEPETYGTETVKMSATDAAGNGNGSISKVEFLRCLNDNVGENKETLLHVAAQGGHIAMIRYLYRRLFESQCETSIVPAFPMSSTHIALTDSLINIITRGADKAPTDHVTLGAPLVMRPPNLQNTKICCELCQTEICSGRRQCCAESGSTLLINTGMERGGGLKNCGNPLMGYLCH
jgi:hypothetical protein